MTTTLTPPQTARRDRPVAGRDQAAPVAPLPRRGRGAANRSATSRQPAASADQLSLLTPRDMHHLTARPLDQHPDVAGLCWRCVERGPKGCPACQQRRRKAVRLREQDHLSIEAIAEVMELPVPRVLRLLEQEADLRELRREEYRVTHIDNAVVRELFEKAQRIALAHGEKLTVAELARLAGMDATHVDRLLGYRPTADAVKNGVTYPGRTLTTISVDNAGRLVRALGYAPCEIEGL